MYQEIVLAGFGGQGVLLIGKLLAYSGMKNGYEVTWLPAYGPEMRGGTCNCTVVISEKPVGSPMSKNPHGLIALNLPSLDKFEDTVRPGGVIVINTSLINRKVKRTDVKVIEVAANDGYLLRNLVSAGIPCLGIEPTADTAATGVTSPRGPAPSAHPPLVCGPGCR